MRIPRKFYHVVMWNVETMRNGEVRSGMGGTAFTSMKGAKQYVKENKEFYDFHAISNIDIFWDIYESVNKRRNKE